MTIGYIVWAQDNDSYFLEKKENRSAATCPKCGYMLDIVNYFNPFFKLKRTDFDLSFTYDQRPIASLKLKEFCLRVGYLNVKFVELEKQPGFFLFIPQAEVKIDIVRSDLTFENYCDRCHQYKGVYGKKRVLDQRDELADGIYRSDILVAGGNNKFPLIIIGPRTKEKLERERMNGLVFDPLE